MAETSIHPQDLNVILTDFLAKINKEKFTPQKKYYTLAEVCKLYNISKSTFLSIVEKNSDVKIKQVTSKHISKPYFIYELKSVDKILTELAYPRI